MMSRNKCVWLSIKPGNKVALPKSILFALAGALTSEGDPTCLILLPSISTAAGLNMFPLRGSSSRAAFTRVTGAGDCASEGATAKARTAIWLQL
jgi:hypothetical protein